QEARAADDSARTGDGADPAAATIARLLRTPPPVAFEEHPLPADVPLLDLSDEAAEKQLAAAAKGLNLPAGVCLARVEREGSRVAALISSQGYDPTGEVSSGAYWLFLSADGGATWAEPLYTDLRINQPYVVRPVSALPLFAGDHLHVEVEIRELDPTKITFPPIDLAPKRTARGLYLDIPLEALTRDSDGDGLTDLAEARLLTDPASPDTDGDGIPDGADPLPTVRESAVEDRSPAALAWPPLPNPCAEPAGMRSSRALEPRCSAAPRRTRPRDRKPSSSSPASAPSSPRSTPARGSSS
ncbi:MAG TPA: hypothetical protein VGK45_05705, partial [Thermoanaerobaculia bacterium]